MPKLRNFFIFIFFIFSVMNANDLRKDEYALDPTHSSVSFAIKHLSVSDTIGVFEDFGGEIFYTKDKILRLKGELDVNSVNTFNVGRDYELKNTDFFTNHKIYLESTSYKNNILYAKVTINGITKNIEFAAKITGPLRNPSLEIKENKDSKSTQNMQSSKPNLSALVLQNNTDNILANPHLAMDNKEDCGCYVSYGENVLGIELTGKINRFDFNISPHTPESLLGKYVDIKIILEVSN